MGEHERIRKSIAGGLIEDSGFLSAKTLNFVSQYACLHISGVDNLIYVQADAFRHNKCRISSTREESLIKTVKNNGEAKHAC
jgi:hypothetical protein